MGKKITIGKSEGFLLTENETNLKIKILDYLYNTINLSKLRYGMLDNIQKLTFLKENEHYVTPNYKGLNYFLIFVSIENKNYAIIINRKKLSYHRNQVDMRTVFIAKIFINTNSNMYLGTIFDGKIIQKNNTTASDSSDYSHYFLIHDCFSMMGKKILDMEMNQKINYLNDIINSNLSNNVCENFSFKLNKLYTYGDIPKIINEIIPESGINSNGLIFYPHKSGNSIIHVERKIDKVGIQSSQNEKIDNKSYDLIFNFTDFLKSRVYSYENEHKHRIFYINKTDIPDVYNLYSKKDSPKEGIAHIPNLKISHYCSNNINATTKVNCVYSAKFDKWIPLQIIE
jgi:hypothetical protein